MIQKFNDWLAIRSTLILGTMWCTYSFVVLCLAPLLLPSQQNNLLYISNCFQLIFLPILLTGQNLLGRNGEQRAATDHAAIMEELSAIRSIHETVAGLHCVKGPLELSADQEIIHA